MCGAVSGAIMAINIFFGRNEPEELVDKCYLKVREMLERFENQFGSTNCQQLIGCDLGTEGGQEAFRANNLREKCKDITEQVTGIAMSIIDEN